MSRRSRVPRSLRIVLLLPAWLAVGCATVPATGERQISFFSEQEEIEMGREADLEIVAAVGLYEDPAMQQYVSGLGAELAAKSERPGLPWSFKVLDDPAVNAFALPGGWIYVTRGIITHLGSESELASVIGHEIGHVTARHGVHQLSKQILAGVGLGLAVLIDPDLETAAAVASLGLNVLFLKHGRADERQADDLGLRYMVGSSHDPRQMPEVFSVLQRVEQVAGAGRLPNWLSTHPDPGARHDRLEKQVSDLAIDFSDRSAGRTEFLRRLDGMVFGADPRDGFFQENVFLHPGMAFRFVFPQGWETLNEESAVSASDPKGEAEMQISLATKETPRAAADEFFSEDGVEAGESWSRAIHGNPALWFRFSATVEESEILGTVAFVNHGGQVFQLLAYGLADPWTRLANDVERSLGSFDRLTDRKALAVKPQRMQIVALREAMTFERFAERFPSTVDVETLALINHAQAGESLERGRLMKRVVGDPPPGAK